MKGMMIAIGVFGMLGSVAAADEVVIHKPGVVIEKRAAAPDDTTTTTRTVRHGDGCATHSVTRSNSATDSSVTQTRTNC